MNNPEYILVEEMATIAAAVKAALGLSVLNYQHGYFTELNRTLQQYNANPDYAALNYPLIWIAEPYEVIRGRDEGIYGTLDNASIFIITSSTKDYTAEQRIDNIFKTILYPIYRELLNQIVISEVFDERSVEQIEHKTTNRYYFDEGGKSVINDVVDCIRISGLKLRISNKQDCKPLSNF